MHVGVTNMVHPLQNGPVQRTAGSWSPPCRNRAEPCSRKRCVMSRTNLLNEQLDGVHPKYLVPSCSRCCAMVASLYKQSRAPEVCSKHFRFQLYGFVHIYHPIKWVRTWTCPNESKWMAAGTVNRLGYSTAGGSSAQQKRLRFALISCIHCKRHPISGPLRGGPLGLLGEGLPKLVA